jgi:hypothetical protein
MFFSRTEILFPENLQPEKSKFDVMRSEKGRVEFFWRDLTLSLILACLMIIGIAANSADDSDDN